MGLDSMEHWYGLPAAMFTDKRVQNYPSDYKYNDEQDRFSHTGRLCCGSVFSLPAMAASCAERRLIILMLQWPMYRQKIIDWDKGASFYVVLIQS